MNIVNPINFLGGLGWCDLQINHDRFLAATHEHTAKRFLAAGVDLLVWHKGWHKNKIARTCVGHILKVLAPPHARPPADHVNDTFQLSMVMSTGLGIGVNGNRARPQLIRTGACVCDGSSPIHAQRLWRVGIELVGADNLHAMLAPINLWNAVSHDSLYRVPASR